MLVRFVWMTALAGLGLLVLRGWAASPSPAPSPRAFPSAEFSRIRGMGSPCVPVAATPSPRAGLPEKLTAVWLERALSIECPSLRRPPTAFGRDGFPTAFGEPESACRAGVTAADWKPGVDVMYRITAAEGATSGAVWMHEAAGGGR